jgi:hypothetical protein
MDPNIPTHWTPGSIGALDTFETRQLHACTLTHGALVCNPDLGTALWQLDHRVPLRDRSGDCQWLVYDFEAGTYRKVRVAPFTLLPVAVRQHQPA